MMCVYCGKEILEEKAVELVAGDKAVYTCDEECAIYFHQEQQERHFQTWIRIEK
jgi:ribosomal protein L24E